MFVVLVVIAEHANHFEGLLDALMIAGDVGLELRVYLHGLIAHGTS